MKFHHIGIGCSSIEECIDYLKPVLDIKDISDTVYDPLQDARLCMLTLEDGVRIELIQGTPVEKIVKKGTYLYHSCYETKDLEETMMFFEERGSIIVSPPKEAVLFGGRRVAFLSSKLGLIELLEE